MPTEQYANLVSTTIAVNYVAGSGALVVTSATGMPSTGNFRILLDAGTANVLLKVTARIGAALTVAAEANDANVASGKTVDLVITAGALDAIKQDAASLTVPSSASGASAAALPMTSWTIVNGAVLSNFSQDAVGVFIPPNSSTNFRFVTQALSAPPYTVIAKLDIRGYDQSSNSGAPDQAAGLYLYDGTKFEDFEIDISGVAPPKLRVTKANTLAGAGGAVLAGPTANLLPLSDMVLKIVDDSTHRTFYYYSNGAFVQFFQEATGAFLTPNAIGFGGLDTGNGTTQLSWLSINLKYWSVS